MADADPRAALERLIVKNGSDFAGLSRLIGRNPAYIQQYIKRGIPRRLAEEDRHALAGFFGVDPSLLGGPPPQPDAAYRAIPRLDVGASAGAGAAVSGERELAPIAFDQRWLRALGAGDAALLSIIRVEGESMVPTLSDGDEILVDRGDGGARLRDGIYVLRIDDALLVKRIARNPADGTIAVRSDNVAYPSWPACNPGAIDVVGRVIWSGRRIA